MARFRHAGLDPASRTSLKSWIPAFAGMTILGFEGAIYKQKLSDCSTERRENYADFSTLLF